MKTFVTKELILDELKKQDKPVSFSMEMLIKEFAEIAADRISLESATITLDRILKWSNDNKLKFHYDERSAVCTFIKSLTKEQCNH